MVYTHTKIHPYKYKYFVTSFYAFCRRLLWLLMTLWTGSLELLHFTPSTRNLTCFWPELDSTRLACHKEILIMCGAKKVSCCCFYEPATFWDVSYKSVKFKWVQNGPKAKKKKQSAGQMAFPAGANRAYACCGEQSIKHFEILLYNNFWLPSELYDITNIVKV